MQTRGETVATNLGVRGRFRRVARARRRVVLPRRGVVLRVVLLSLFANEDVETKTRHLELRRHDVRLFRERRHLRLGGVCARRFTPDGVQRGAFALGGNSRALGRLRRRSSGRLRVASNVRHVRLERGVFRQKVLARLSRRRRLGVALGERRFQLGHAPRQRSHRGRVFARDDAHGAGSVARERRRPPRAVSLGAVAGGGARAPGFGAARGDHRGDALEERVLFGENCLHDPRAFGGARGFRLDDAARVLGREQTLLKGVCVVKPGRPRGGADFSSAGG